jgi:hypothetical protein
MWTIGRQAGLRRDTDFMAGEDGRFGEKYRRMELSTQLIAHRSFAQGASLCHVCLVWFLPTPTTLKAKFSLVPGARPLPEMVYIGKSRAAAMGHPQRHSARKCASQRSRVPRRTL